MTHTTVWARRNDLYILATVLLEVVTFIRCWSYSKEAEAIPSLSFLMSNDNFTHVRKEESVKRNVFFKGNELNGVHELTANPPKQLQSTRGKYPQESSAQIEELRSSFWAIEGKLAIQHHKKLVLH